MTPASQTGGKRSDAARNVEAILDASVGVLSTRPDASMAEIARSSGVSRQTVYAHFPSRESLLFAVAERARDRAVASIDSALGGGGEPAGQLNRLVPAWWETVGEHAHVLGVLDAELSDLDGGSTHQFHEPILERLEDLAARGQADGSFDGSVTAEWLAAAFLGLVHTAADEVARGRMDREEARAALEASIPNVFGVSRGRR